MSDKIPQRDLRKAVDLKSEISSLRRQLNAADAELKRMKASIIEKLNSGVPIREGRLTAEVRPGSRKNSLSYDRLSDLLGEEITEQIKDSIGSSDKIDLEIFESR